MSGLHVYWGLRLWRVVSHRMSLQSRVRVCCHSMATRSVNSAR